MIKHQRSGTAAAATYAHIQHLLKEEFVTNKICYKPTHAPTNIIIIYRFSVCDIILMINDLSVTFQLSPNLLNYHLLYFYCFFHGERSFQYFDKYGIILAQWRQGSNPGLWPYFCHTRSNLGISAMLEILQTCKLDHKVAIKCTWDQHIGCATHPPTAIIISLPFIKAWELD